MCPIVSVWCADTIDYKVDRRLLHLRLLLHRRWSINSDEPMRSVITFPFLYRRIALQPSADTMSGVHCTQIDTGAKAKQKTEKNLTTSAAMNTMWFGASAPNENVTFYHLSSSSGPKAKRPKFHFSYISVNRCALVLSVHRAVTHPSPFAFIVPHIRFSHKHIHKQTKFRFFN